MPVESRIFHEKPELGRVHSGRLFSVRVSEELVAKSIRNEMIRPSYARLEKHMSYFILTHEALEDNSFVTYYLVTYLPTNFHTCPLGQLQHQSILLYSPQSTKPKHSGCIKLVHT